jgi:hypothetical protein
MANGKISMGYNGLAGSSKLTFEPETGNIISSNNITAAGIISGANIIDNSIKYSTVTIVFPFTSTGTTTASMIGQTVDIPCIGSDYIVKNWCCNANVAGTFTMTTSTATFSNTPVYGNSIMQNSSPNLVSTIASSGTVTGAGTVPAGGFLRATCNSATLIDQITVGIQVWVIKK